MSLFFEFNLVLINSLAKPSDTKPVHNNERLLTSKQEHEKKPISVEQWKYMAVNSAFCKAFTKIINRCSVNFKFQNMNKINELSVKQITYLI